MKTPHAILLQTGDLKDFVRFDWNAMDAWYEEEQEVYVHPLDPHCRVDIRPCSREIKVELEGVEVAKTNNSMILFETGAPPRYYLLQTSVSRFSPSSLVYGLGHTGSFENTDTDRISGETRYPL